MDTLGKLIVEKLKKIGISEHNIIDLTDFDLIVYGFTSKQIVTIKKYQSEVKRGI